jgi:phosphomevalonate kinase
MDDWYTQWKDVDWTIGGALVELRDHVQQVRRLFREMGALAGVPIEPDEQTALIDATLTVPGVLIAGVPGGSESNAFCLSVSRSFY